MAMKLSFEQRISIIIVFAILIVTITGIYAYGRFAVITEKYSKNLEPDLRLLTSKQLLNSINDAELNVSSFRINSDTNYLNSFYESVNRIDYSMKHLRLLSENSNDDNVYLNLDSLEHLIELKINVLNDFLLLQDGFRTQKALDKVLRNIQNNNSAIHQINSDDTLNLMDEANQENHKPTLFDRIFRKKNKQIVTDTLEANQNLILTKPETLDYSNVYEKVELIKSDEAIIQSAYKDKELALTVKDQLISEKIIKFFNDYERQELTRISDESDKAEKEIERTNSLVGRFFVLIGAMIFLMAFVIGRYIADNNKYRKQLKKSKEEAEELAQVKQRFLANMSHEMRTPMNAIIGFAEQLSKSDLNKHQKDQIEMVLKSSDHLLQIINEVLDLTKLQAGKTKLEPIPFVPADFFDEMFGFLEIESAQKKIQVASNIDQELPEVLVGDIYRIKKIIFNLFSNAVKFTHEGSILFTVQKLEEDETNCLVRIQVADTGIGMNDEQLRHVFDEFEQASISTTRQYGGTGLGLTIVKFLVELFDGTIDVISSPESGTTITIEISLEKGNESMLQQSNNDNTDETIRENWQGLKVIIADDEKYNRLLLKTICEKLKMNYVEAENGEEVLSLVKSDDFDLLLLDIRMPKMNGLEACKRIRFIQDKKKATIPIIALTAATLPQDINNFRKVGITAWLSKPFKEVEFIQILSTILFNKKEQVATEILGTIKFENLKNICNNDSKFYGEMLQTYLESLDENAELIRKFYESKDIKAIGEIAHRLSSSTKHIGDIELYELLKSIERVGLNEGSMDELNTLYLRFDPLVEKLRNDVLTELKRTKT